MDKILQSLTVHGKATGSNTSESYDDYEYVNILYLDKDSFDPITSIFFDVNLLTLGATASAALIDSEGSVVTGTEVSTTSEEGVRIRTEDIKNTLSTGEYVSKIKTSNPSFNSILLDARLLVIQEGTVAKTESHAPVVIYYVISTSTTYSYPLPVGRSVLPFYWDTSKYDGTVSVFFEVTGYSRGEDSHAYFRMVDADTEEEVVGSELNDDTHETVRLRSGDLSGVLENGHTYLFQYKDGVALAARMVIKQTGTPSKTVARLGLLSPCYASTTTTFWIYYSNYLTLFDDEYFSDITDYYVELNANVNEGDTGYYAAYDRVSLDEDSAVTTDSTAWIHLKQSDPVIDSGEELCLAIKSGEGVLASCSGAQLVIEASFGDGVPYQINKEYLLRLG